MPRLIVNTPDGGQEELQLGVGGSYFDPSRIVWCWDRDGDPPLAITLGYMERIEKIELVKDVNGKQQYDIIYTGEHKSERKKVPVKQLVTYLRNNRLGKIAASRKPPKRLEPSE